MSLSDGYHLLANIVASIEESGGKVADTSSHDVEEKETLSVDLRVKIPLKHNSPFEKPLNADQSQPAAGSLGGTSPDEGETGDEADDHVDSTEVEDTSEGGQDDSDEFADASGDDVHSGETSDGGTITCRFDGCDTTFETEHGMKIHFSRVHGNEVNAEPDYDSKALRDVYERCETFAEMAESLDTDVTPQTIRRRMIRRGIHQPNTTTGNGLPIVSSPARTKGGTVEADSRGDEDEQSSHNDENESEADSRETGGQSDGRDESQEMRRASEVDTTPDGKSDDQTDDTDWFAESGETQSEPEGSDDGEEAPLPPNYEVDGGITVEELRDAVKQSSTLYAVQQQLDLERETTTELLAKYDLLELVQGRLASKYQRDQMKGDIDVRINRNLEGQASSA